MGLTCPYNLALIFWIDIYEARIEVPCEVVSYQVLKLFITLSLTDQIREASHNHEWLWQLRPRSVRVLIVVVAVLFLFDVWRIEFRCRLFAA